MTTSLHDVWVPTCTQTLHALSGVLDKTAAYATARKIEPAVLLGARLFPDMFPLTRQVQLTTDFAKNGAARATGVEAPDFGTGETSFEALKERIAKAIAFLGTLTPAQFDAGAAKDVTVKLGGKDHTVKAQTYLLHFALPNFYFHASTAYDILRHCGVEVGKRDFIGAVPGIV